MDRQKIILVFVGPSGSGKTTVGNELTKRGIPKLVTTTTRHPRSGEQHGVDYYFRNQEEMKAEKFVEQTSYNGNTYGLTVKEVDQPLKEHNAVHVSLDQNGAEAMRESYPSETKIVYFNVPEKKMVQRMEKRGDSKVKIQERLDFCRKSGENQIPEATDLVVENDEIQRTAETILSTFNLKKNISV